ncbi:hypothetical protein GGR77_002876 [Xanthomonas translucens]
MERARGVFSLRTDDPAELASALRTSLENPIEDLAHPPQSEWKHIQRPLLQAAGVKTWAALGTKAKAVGVEWDGGSVAFIPSVEFRHHGGRANAGSTLHCGIDDGRLGLQLLEASSAQADGDVPQCRDRRRQSGAVGR